MSTTIVTTVEEINSGMKDGQTVTGYYIAKNKAELKTKAGKDYISMKVSDATGTADAKIWALSNKIAEFKNNDIIKATGNVTTYQGASQFNIITLEIAKESEYAPESLIPMSKTKPSALYVELAGIIDTLKDGRMKQLLERVLMKNKKLKKAFMSHSAAKTIHHAYSGGWLEHTVGVTKICGKIADQYKVNRPLLITGALLHDIGKLDELSPFPENDYTDEGTMLGHVYMGAEFIAKEINAMRDDGIDFPQELENMLKHMLLSHHGLLEWGSPKAPVMLEAHILHLADMMDTRISMVSEFIENGSPNEKYVGFNKSLGSYIRHSETGHLED